MKRSRSIELALMGSVPLLLAACDPPAAEQQSALLYQNLQQCVSAGQVSADVCAKAYADAVQAQVRDAPRFDSRGECEAQFGYDQCHSVTSSSGHWFMPALAGFLVGRALSHPYDHRRDDWYGGPGGYGYGGWGGWGGQPIYHARGDRAPWRMGDGERFGWGARGPGGQSVAATLSRGGFGFSGAARGSWGG
ncbi:MAG TPA: DUF1190 domain-containing protein [Steroidobacteraceae bacterium]|nr:DUF1190 domain-containing protein [Steroidobacteraceae bacterium]